MLISTHVRVYVNISDSVRFVHNTPTALIIKSFYFVLQGLTKHVFPEQAGTYSLVSNGAECIMISKKFFFEKANEAVLHNLREVVCTNALILFMYIGKVN